MSHRLTAALTAPVFALLLIPCCALAQPEGRTQRAQAQPGDRFAEVRARIERIIREERIPSVSVAVAEDGQVLWEESFGWADRERRVVATPHTPYSLASITKPITSTAVMGLSERGKIDLDAPIENYLGRMRLFGYAGDTHGVTARRIMAHSAGLPQHFYFYHAGYPPPNAEETLTRYGVVVFPPGEHFQYSNIGYRALDVAISRTSGQSFGDFLRREIFLPLGMTRTSVDVMPSLVGEAATRYDSRGNPIPPYMTDTPGSGDVWSSAHDLLRFGMFHLGTLLPGQIPVLKRETVRTMHQVASAPGSPQPWGLGWTLGTERGYRVVSHGGQQPGVDAQLALYPDENLAIVLLANQNNWKVRDIVQEIAKVVLPRPARAASPVAVATPTTESRPRLTGKWEGTVTTYESTVPFSLNVQPDGDIHVKLGTQHMTLLNQVGSYGRAIRAGFHGTLPTPEGRKHRTSLTLTILPSGGEMVGQLVAESVGDPSLFGLSGFVRLAPARP